jgi:hypothetical protein
VDLSELVKSEMNSLQESSQLTELIERLVEDKVGDTRPDLLNLFFTFQNESLAAWNFLDNV